MSLQLLYVKNHSCYLNSYKHIHLETHLTGAFLPQRKYVDKQHSYHSNHITFQYCLDNSLTQIGKKKNRAGEGGLAGARGWYKEASPTNKLGFCPNN